MKKIHYTPDELALAELGSQKMFKHALKDTLPELAKIGMEPHKAMKGLIELGRIPKRNGTEPLSGRL